MKNFADRKQLFRQITSLKLPARKLFLILGIVFVCGLLLLAREARKIYLATETTLENERLKHLKKSVVSFSRVPLKARTDLKVWVRQSAKNVRSLAHFENYLYAATDGGLLRMDEKGAVVRHFTVLDGLPESDLTSLAVFRSKLYIGTKSKGLLEFDGQNLTGFRLENHETKSITALFSDERALLIGTYAGGLLEFDGENLTEITAAEKRLGHITFLQADRSRAIVGTFDEGLWLRQNGVWKNFRTADGLLSNRVVGAQIVGENLFVASDLGVSKAQLTEIFEDSQNVFRQTAALPTLSSITARNDLIYLAKDNGEIYTLPGELKYLETAKLQKHAWKKPEKFSNARLIMIFDDIWLLSNQGAWKNAEKNLPKPDFSSFGDFVSDNDLTENTVSALSFDAAGRLFAGTFRRGIDVFAPDGRKLKTIENETVREINFLVENRKEKTILAATSAGVVQIAANFDLTLPKDEIPGRSVAQISIDEDESKPARAIAASKGLVWQTKEASRIYSSLNGLPGNTVNTTLFAGGKLFVGTTGGLAELENGQIRRVYKTSNSELKNNWVTALAAAGDRIFIGTYGGGIFELLPSGEIRSFAAEPGRVFVNPNAFYADRAALYIGTLEGAWRLDLTTQKWSQIKDILPAETVLSITGDGRTVIFGTTGGLLGADASAFDELEKRKL